MSLELSDIQKQLEEISKKKNQYASRRANLARSGRKFQSFVGTDEEEKKRNANAKKIDAAARKVVAAGGDASRVRGSGKTGRVTTTRRRDTTINRKQQKGVSDVKVALGQKEVKVKPNTGKGKKGGGKKGGAKKVTAPKPKKAPAPKKVKVSQDVREIASRQGLTIGGKKIGRAGKVSSVNIDGKYGRTPAEKPKLGITSPKNINLSSVASLDAVSWFLNKVAAQMYGGKGGGFSVSGHKPATAKITTQGSGKENMINPKTGKKWRAARDDAGNVVGAETPSTKPISNTQPNVQPTTFKSPNQKSPQSKGQKRRFALTTQPAAQGNQGGATTRGTTQPAGTGRSQPATSTSDAVRRGIRGLKNTSVTSLEAVSWYLNKISYDKRGKVVTGKGGGVKRNNTATKPKKVAQGHEDFPVLTSEKELENVKLQNYRNINNSLDFVEFGLDVLKTLKNEIYKEDNPKITQDAKSLKVRGSDHRAKRKPIGSTRDDEKLSHKLNYD